jgi:hypothetical protein
MNPPDQDRVNGLKELLARARELVVRKKNLLTAYRKRREEARVKELREKLGATNSYED